MSILLLLSPFALAGAPVLGLEAQVGPTVGLSRDLGAGAMIGWRLSPAWTVELGAAYLRTLGVSRPDALGAVRSVETSRRGARASLLPVLTVARGSLGWDDPTAGSMTLAIDLGAGASAYRERVTYEGLGPGVDRLATQIGPSWVLGPRLILGELELRLRLSGSHWLENSAQLDPNMAVVQQRLVTRVHTGLSIVFAP